MCTIVSQSLSDSNMRWKGEGRVMIQNYTFRQLNTRSCVGD